MNAPAMVASLGSFPAILPAAVAGLSEADARWKPASGAWSVVEIVNHLVDEEVDDFRRRLELTLRDPKLEWPPNDPEGWARERSYNERALAESVARFLAEREASLAWLSGLGEKDWGTTHTHRVFGSLAAGDLLASWAAHDWLHLRQIAKRRYELAAREPGRFSVDYAGKWGA
ncbi:MAG: DinB family protein [Phycisphaerales bacterium]